MPNEGDSQTASSTRGDWWVRNSLAFAVVGLSIVGIGLIAWVAIENASADTRADTTRLVFVSMLPLFGTWVGTVLAYYFSRENLREATTTARTLSETTAKLSGMWLPTMQVRDVMTPPNRVETYQLQSPGTAPDKPEDVPLSDLWNKLGTAPFDRLPIVDPNNVAQALVMRQDLMEWAAGQQDAMPQVFVQKKVSDLATTPTDLHRLLHQFVTVAPDATLASAKSKLEAAMGGAKTVLVTNDGTETSPLAGLLTDTDILTNLKP